MSTIAAVVLIGPAAASSTSFVPVSSAGASPAKARSAHVISAKPGDIVRHGPVAVITPRRGEGIAASATAVTGDYYLHVWTAADGTVYSESSNPSIIGGDSGGPDECADTFQPGTFGYWTTTLSWYFNTATVPSGNTVTNVTTDLTTGTAHITGASNTCGRSDSVSATASYLGSRSGSTNIAADGTCQTNDSVNMVDFGDLPDSSGIIAENCDWLSGSTVLESDMRFNKVMSFPGKTYGWRTDATFGGCAPGFSNFIVDEIATHERGHSFGLGDVYDTGHPELTMYGYSGPCQVQKEQLALGDMLALEALY